MSRIFISHSHNDNASAIAVGQWLTAHGWNDFFLDISPDRGLSPGERWQEALKRAADRCQAVLFLISDEWLQSRWCLAEFLLAKQLGKVIFGVLVQPTPLDRLPPEMRNEWQLCDLVAGVERQTFRVRLEDTGEQRVISFAEAGLVRLRHGIERAGLDPSTFSWPPPTDPDRAPYAGLRALDREDAAVFFGREAPLTLAMDTLRRLRESRPERLFVILGASGAGKSSFLRAGLLPRLARDDRNFLVVPTIRPERAAVSGTTGLLNALEGAFKSVRAPVNRADLRASLDSTDAFVALVGRLRAAARARLSAEGGSAAPTIVVPIDQAEELFAAEHRAEAERLLTLLRNALRADAPGGAAPDPGAFALVSIRSDSYERLQTEPLLADVKQHVFSLPPLPREEYKAVIEGPAARHDAAGHRLRVDPQLTAHLLDDAQGADALPLLAFTLERLFLEHGADGVLSVDDYGALGGVEGSIEAAVKSALADPGREPAIPADDAVQSRLLKAAFIPWLARVDPETEERKRRVALWEELPAESHPILERLIQQRLLLRDRRRVPGSAVEAVVVEVAHEALLRRWPMLTLWLEQDADALKTIELARRAAAEWDKRNRREAWLNHSTERLAAVESLLARPDLERLLGEQGRAYIRACRHRDDAEAAEALARERELQENELRIQQAEQAAERDRLKAAQAEAAQSAERAASAQRLFRRTLIGAGFAVVAMIVAIGAAVWARTQQHEAERALGTLNVTEGSRQLAAGLVPQAVAHLAEAVRLVPDETVWRAALASTLITNRWARMTVDVRTADAATSAAFSPDGKRVVIAAGDEARVWDRESGQQVGRPLRHRNVVRDAQFGADGVQVVTASQDRTVRIWRALDGEALGAPISHDGAVRHAAFAPGGRQLVTLSGSTTRVIEPGPSASDAGSVASPDWRSTIAVSANGTAAAIASGSQIRVLRRASAASGDEGTAARAATRRYLASWRGGGAQLFPLDDPAITTTTLAISSFDRPLLQLADDGSRLLIVERGADGTTVHAWDAGERKDVELPLGAAPVELAELCPTGEVVATAAGGSVTLWDSTAGAQIGAPVFHTANVHAIAFSPDCRLGISIAAREARVWDAKAGGLLAQPLVHSSAVTAARFSPDAQYVATLSESGAHVWDLRTGGAGGEPLRHPSEYSRVAFSVDGLRVVTALGKEVRTWDAQTGSPLATPIEFEGEIVGLSISPDGERVLVAAGETATVYRTATGERIGRARRIIESKYGDTTTPIVSPDWNTVLTRTQKSARLWNVESGERVGKLLVHRQPIADVSFSRDGTLIVTASEDTTARVWSAATGEPVSNPLRHEQAVVRALFSGDGSRLVTLSDRLISVNDESYGVPREVRVWDARSGEPAGPTISHDENVTALAINPDGTRVVTARGTSAQLWDVERAAQVGNAIEFDAAVTAATYSADGARIVITAGDTAYLYDAARLVEIGRPLKSGAPIVRAAFTPDEQRLLVITTDPSTTGNADEPEGFDGEDPCPQNACRQHAALWDVPTLTADDATLLTDVAAILAGYRISALGALEVVTGRRQSADTLLQSSGDSRQRQTAGQRIARWLLADPAGRPVSPLAVSPPRQTKSELANAVQ